MLKQSSLYCQYQLFWSCPSQQSSLSCIGKEGRIEGMTSLLLASTSMSGENVTFEGERHQCLGGDPCCEHQRAESRAGFIHNRWGHGCTDGKGCLPMHTGLCACLLTRFWSCLPGVAMPRPAAARSSGRDRSRLCLCLPGSREGGAGSPPARLPL